MGCAASRSLTTASSLNSRRATAVAPDDHAASALSIRLQTEALELAQQLLEVNKGKNVKDTYVRSTLVSVGANCRLLSAYHKHTGDKVAIKAIIKKQDPQQANRQHFRVLKEVAIMKYVEDHPNAVALREVFQDERSYYLVMDYMSGGELFEHTTQKGALTERHAAQICRSILLFLAHIHSRGVAHMDLKPENIMFDSEGAEGVVKVVDFGASHFVQPGEVIKHAFGTVKYCSPEMARDRPSQKTDIWSAGVIMYITLTGAAPFHRSNERATIALLRSQPHAKFSGGAWSGISQAAKDCIRAMLTPDADARPSAQQVLHMPWLHQEAPDTGIGGDTLSSLRTFVELSHIKRLLRGILAKNLQGNEANKLVHEFLSLDVDVSGVLEYQELADAARAVQPSLSDGELQKLFGGLDVDGTGTIDVTEFFAGAMELVDPEQREAMVQATFKVLDRKGSGFLTKDQVRSVLVASNPCVASDSVLHAQLEEELLAMDVNGDGVIDYEEFRAAVAPPSPASLGAKFSLPPSSSLAAASM